MNSLVIVTDKDIEVIASPLRGRVYCGAPHCEFFDEETEIILEHVNDYHGEQMDADLEMLRTGQRPMLYQRVPMKVFKRIFKKGIVR